MIPLRKPKRRPSDVACPACGQVVGWERCEGCQGYGSWDPGLGVFDCVLCGGVAWQQEPHPCPDAVEDAAAQGLAGGKAAGDYVEPEDTGEFPLARGLASGGHLRKIALLAIVLVVLFLILATAAAALLAGLQ